jgi:hypothetical protein
MILCERVFGICADERGEGGHGLGIVGLQLGEGWRCRPVPNRIENRASAARKSGRGGAQQPAARTNARILRKARVEPMLALSATGRSRQLSGPCRVSAPAIPSAREIRLHVQHAWDMIGRPPPAGAVAGAVERGEVSMSSDQAARLRSRRATGRGRRCRRKGKGSDDDHPRQDRATRPVRVYRANPRLGPCLAGRAAQRRRRGAPQVRIRAPGDHVKPPMQNRPKAALI